MIDNNTIFRDINITKGLTGYKIPTILLPCKCDYVVWPASLWDEVNYCFHDLEINGFEHSGHHLMFKRMSCLITVF